MFIVETIMFNLERANQFFMLIMKRPAVLACFIHGASGTYPLSHARQAPLELSACFKDTPLVALSATLEVTAGVCVHASMSMHIYTCTWVDICIYACVYLCAFWKFTLGLGFDWGVSVGWLVGARSFRITEGSDK